MMQGISIEDLLKMLAGRCSGEEREESDDQEENADGLGPLPKIRQACIMNLKWRCGKIRELELRIAALAAKRNEEIKEHDSLVEELKQLDAMFAQVDVSSPAVGPVDAGSSDGPNPPATPPSENPMPPPDENPTSPTAPQEPVPRKADADEPATAKRRGRKAKFTAEFKRLAVHKPTGNLRLDALETALHDALERLNNTKMAYHFMAIKEVRLALTDLYRAWDKPDAERIAELEAGLKDAVDKLSANRSAANSKIMPQIWGDIIVALQGSKDNNQ